MKYVFYTATFIVGLLFGFLVMTGTGRAAQGPEASPQAVKAGHHARIVRHSYTYRTVWVTSDGVRFPVVCRVTGGGTFCRVSLSW